MTAQAASFIVFSVGGTAFALRSAEVQHMEMVEEVTRVPNAPPFVDGVVFSRGLVVPAVNLRVRFGFERTPYDLRTRLIVVRAQARSVGLVVDESREFIRIDPEAIQPPHAAVGGLGADYVDGIASIDGRLIVVLNLERLMSLTEPLLST